MRAFDTPILFLLFNRPDLTERVFARIRAMRPKTLYIAADGPRSDRIGEEDLCRETRAIVEIIDWPCEVRRRYQERNLGCKLGVSSAISWFFDNVESGIILEDDILPDPSFFWFAAEMLDRFRDDARIATINCASFGRPNSGTDASYFLTRYPMIWGWATWRRTWNLYDLEMNQWPASRDRIQARFISETTAKFFDAAFDHAKAGIVDTWDYQLNLSIFLNEGFSISPVTNLVENIGFDGRATHTQVGDSPTDEFPVIPLKSPIVHLSALIPDDSADQRIEQRFFGGRRSLLERAVAKTRRLLKRLHHRRRLPT